MHWTRSSLTFVDNTDNTAGNAAVPRTYELIYDLGGDGEETVDAWDDEWREQYNNRELVEWIKAGEKK